MKNLYFKPGYDLVLNRISKLNDNTPAQWGKMDVAQMMAHCAEVLEAYNGDKPFGKTGLIAKLFKGMVKKVVFGPDPYKKNTPTLRQFMIIESKDFTSEKERLLNALARFHAMPREDAESLVHPLFGKSSTEERGWAMYKHLDHHLLQFGV